MISARSKELLIMVMTFKVHEMNQRLEKLEYWNKQYSGIHDTKIKLLKKMIAERETALKEVRGLTVKQLTEEHQD